MINLNDYEKILIGLGSYFDTKVDESLDELDKLNIISNSDDNEIYDILKKILADKDYFIVTTCRDGKLINSGLKNVVAPCGGFRYLQCENDCEHELLEYKSSMSKEALICPHCKGKVVFNRLPIEHYNEGGYMEDWEEYNRWLQSSINKKLLILELGVDLSYPSVIRFATEKLCFFNQKSKMYRVHPTLAFSTPEIKERCESVMGDPLTFMKENFNESI